jgi:hypothetical protein
MCSVLLMSLGLDESIRVILCRRQSPVSLELTQGSADVRSFSGSRSFNPTYKHTFFVCFLYLYSKLLDHLSKPARQMTMPDFLFDTHQQFVSR